MNKLKLLYIKIKQNKWINKYTITLVIFGILITFFDSNSLIARYKVYREKQQLKKEIAEYKKISKTTKNFSMLSSPTPKLSNNSHAKSTK